MSASDIYYTIDKESEGEYKDRGSKFFGYLKPISDIEQFEVHLESVKAVHHKARHHCFAYRFLDTDIFRYTDDGEPSGTAGKPIYNQLLSHKLVNVSCIVVRYFGGTKLGTSGLIQAYRGAAIEAITHAEIIEKYITVGYKLSFDYSIMGPLLDVIKQMDIELTEKVFDQNPYLITLLRQSRHEEIITALKAQYLNRSPEDITEDTVIPGLKIEML